MAARYWATRILISVDSSLRGIRIHLVGLQRPPGSLESRVGGSWKRHQVSRNILTFGQTGLGYERMIHSAVDQATWLVVDILMLILTWNVNQFGQELSLPKKIKNIRSVEPDIVTLQEVRSDLVEAWEDQLKECGLDYIYWSGKDVQPTNYELTYACLIASCWPVTPGDDCWRREAPYPELLGRATVSVPEEDDVDVFTAHIPNGCGNGWKKIDTLHVLSKALHRAMDSPRILTGDFNEPKEFRTSGQIVTFEENPHGTWCDQFGDCRPRIEWISGVQSVLDGTSQHGLRDAYRDFHGFDTPTPVTHITQGHKRCFDHTFVSRHLRVLNCGYCHKWRHRQLSDHSPMWTRLCLPQLIPWESDCP